MQKQLVHEMDAKGESVSRRRTITYIRTYIGKRKCETRR